MVTVFVNDCPLQMEIDTGAEVSIIPEKIWNTARKHVPVMESQARLSAYNGSALKVVGEACVTVRYRAQIVQRRVLIVQEGNHALFGRDWLKHISLDWPSIFKPVNSVTSLEEVYLDDLAKEFPTVFCDGLGTVKDHETKIFLQEGAQPGCCQPQPVLYAIRSSVDAELDRLEAEGIIKPVSHAEWASPLVVVRKKNGDMRLCADFKVTINQHVDARQHPVPNPNDLLSRIAGGSVFSTLDLSQAYAQLPLEESSKQYCMITTHRGLYAYQHLPFGVSSAPAIWQRIMDTNLQGLSGVVCFFDNVLAGGK